MPLYHTISCLHRFLGEYHSHDRSENKFGHCIAVWHNGMGNRRFTRVAVSDEEDDTPPRPQQQKQLRQSTVPEENRSRQRTRKRMKLQEEEEDEDEEDDKKKKRKQKDKDEEGSVSVDEEEEPPQEDAKPVGDPIRVSGKGRGRRKHYDSFEFDGNQYILEDPVLLVPEDKNQKPYVAIIKDITQSLNGSMMVTGQWFYRPEEAERKGGGSWQSRDTRELFYSFHRDEVPAESVMHKCVVHFIPLHKQLPNRKQHPGFIVQKVYDTVERKLWKLTDKDYEDSKQHEIDELVQKTVKRIGEIPDLVETEEAPADQEDQLKSKRSFRRRNISPLDVSRDEEATPKSEQHLKPETPGSCLNNTSEHYQILANFKVLTGDSHRDKWLERLLQSIQFMCNSEGGKQKEDNAKDNSNAINHGSNNGSSVPSDCQDRDQKSSESFVWPDAAVPAIVALEKASHDALASDYQKYNQKLRQLAFNLKNHRLARRLLNGELQPAKILNMSPNELKEGLAADEVAKNEPDESQHMQMTDARCSRCMECKVGVRDIIHAGHGDRYQLECIGCGNSWYASRDAVSYLTIDGSDTARSVGTAPWATAKFENVEKKLVSPREPDKSANDVFKKTSEAYMPVLETQKSFGKSRKDESSEPTKHAD